MLRDVSFQKILFNSQNQSQKNITEDNSRIDKIVEVIGDDYRTDGITIADRVESLRLEIGEWDFPSSATIAQILSFFEYQLGLTETVGYFQSKNGRVNFDHPDLDWTEVDLGWRKFETN